MNLISLTICRNSAWSIASVVGHALRYCDSAVVLCHACTDETVPILRAMDRVDVIEVGEADRWSEMDHRQRTLDRGRDLGGTHFLILDDDEFAANPLASDLRRIAGKLRPGMLVQQPLYCCWRSLGTFRADFFNPRNPFRGTFKSVMFADGPWLNWETRGGYQHHHTAPYGAVIKRHVPKDSLGWLHIQHAYWPRLVLKQSWYMAMEVCHYGAIKANYAGSMDETGLLLGMVPPHWWSDLKSGIDLESEPWQLADLKRMVKKMGVKTFEKHGIDVKAALEPWEAQA